MNTNKNKAAQFTSSLAAKAYLVVALGCGLLWAGPRDNKAVPFKGRIDGSFVATPTPNPAIMLSEAHAVGLATHLGEFTKVTSDVVDIVTGETEGVFTMTAANGDHLTGAYSGYITFGATPGAFSWLLKATFTGGTGRFHHATGEFVFMAAGNLDFGDGVVTGKYTETFDGSISY